MVQALAIAAIALPIIGGAIGGVEAIKNANIRNAQLQAQSNVAKFNAGIAQQNASLAAQNTQNSLMEARRKANLQTGSARAQSGALGVFGGSSLDILDDINSQSIFEQHNIVQAGISQQQSALNQAASFQAESKNAKIGQSSGILPALGSIVSGFGGAVNNASLMGVGTASSPFASSGDSQAYQEGQW